MKDGRPFTFAELWENWKDPESGEWLRTCTIITGAQIHPLMPVILPKQHHAAWLGETENRNLKELLLPYPADQMRMWEISPRINRGAESEGSDDPIQSRDSRALARCPAVGINPLLGEGPEDRLPDHQCAS
jgi:putative SOS response-associated peptidase YedK